MDLLDSAARREILGILRDGELSAGDIAGRLDRPRPGVSHHLSILQEAGLVDRRVVGAYRYYRLNLAATLAAWDHYLKVASLGQTAETAA